MSDKIDDVNQVVITNGCLQILYVNGVSSDGFGQTAIKSYVEHLDIFLVFEGEIEINVYNQKRKLQAGDLFFCTRSTYVESKNTSGAFSYARLRFIKDKLENSLLEKRFAASILGCSIIKQKIFNHCLSFIEFFDNSCDKLPIEEAEMVHQENIEILSILEIMIAQEHEHLEIVPNKLSYNALVVEAVDIFEENIEANMKVSDVAETINISNSYLIRIFKSNLGVVPNVFWKTMKINYSLSLISLKLESICDISYMLGFTDQSHFTNCFKKYLHTTPGNFTA